LSFACSLCECLPRNMNKEGTTQQEVELADLWARLNFTDVEEAKELCLQFIWAKLTLENAIGPSCLVLSYSFAVLIVFWLQRTTIVSASFKRLLIVLPIGFFFATPVLVRNTYPPIVSFLVSKSF